MTKRDVVFLVADGGMEQMLLGFLGRPQVHRSIRCGPFDFNPGEDLFVRMGDSLVYKMARDLLQPFERRHQRAVVMLDAAWGGSPGAQAIRENIEKSLDGVWEQYAVVVIDSELEAWVWQDNPNVAEALKCSTDFRQILADSGHWPYGRLKPSDPKAALEYLKSLPGNGGSKRADGSNAALRRLAEKISVRHCQDPAFNHLCEHLRAWFPENS